MIYLGIVGQIDIPPKTDSGNGDRPQTGRFIRRVGNLGGA